jgi:hypothetical protein
VAQWLGITHFLGFLLSGYQQNLGPSSSFRIYFLDHSENQKIVVSLASLDCLSILPVPYSPVFEINFQYQA